MLTVKAISAVVLLALAATPTTAHAQRRGIHSCTVDATGVAFGSVTALSVVRTTGTITLVCDGDGNNQDATVALSSGAGSFAQRKMTRGLGGLSYNLFSDIAATTIWGNGTGGSAPVDVEFDFRGSEIVTQHVTVFAVLPAQSPPAPGVYTDLIVVTVSF